MNLQTLYLQFLPQIQTFGYSLLYLMIALVIGWLMLRLVIAGWSVRADRLKNLERYQAMGQQRQ